MKGDAAPLVSVAAEPDEKGPHGAIISGELTIAGLDTIDDHYSLYELFIRAVVESGWAPREEVVRELCLCTMEEEE